MAKFTEYEDLYTHRAYSILPPEAQRATRELGIAVKSRSVCSAKIMRYRQLLTDLPAAAVPRAMNEIRNIASLYQGYHRPVQREGLVSKLFKIQTRQASLPDLLRVFPDLGWLIIFHGNGYLRQAALESLKTAPVSEFEFTALAYRLNDWVDNVRVAAESGALRVFKKASPAVADKSAFFLLSQSATLTRWSEKGQQILCDSFYRDEVLEHLELQFLNPRQGTVGRSFQQLLKRDALDVHIERLASDAALPSERASAMDALLNRRARWFAVHRREWVDKSLGKSQRVAEFNTRPLTLKVDFEKYFMIASSDKSAQVRKVAADALIANRAHATETMDAVARSLETDKSMSVRTCIEFYLRKRMEDS